MGHPSRLANPIALTAVSVVPIVRGVGYMLADLAPHWSVAADMGPTFPGPPLWVVGMVWIVLGVFMLATMWVWRWFRLAASLAVGVYITWSIIYVGDLFKSPDTLSITFLAGFIAMVPIIITLVGIELDRDCERDLETAGVDGEV